MKAGNDNGGPFETWQEVHAAYLADELPDINFDEIEEEFEDVIPIEEGEMNIEMALARMRVDVPVQRPLGDRLIDYELNWGALRQFDYSEEALKNFLGSYKPINIQIENRIPDNMNPTPDQGVVMDLCLHQLESLQQNVSPTIKRVIVQGKAGTGKSFLINKMVTIIRERLGVEAVQVLAPTGVAATNINGSTYHSFLKIYGNMSSLQNAARRYFQIKMEPIKFLIFDEVSMIGLRVFGNIESSCKEGKPGISEPFVGMIIYFFGDL